MNWRIVSFGFDRGNSQPNSKAESSLIIMYLTSIKIYVQILHPRAHIYIYIYIDIYYKRI
jgi:hypothetical protein